MVPADSPAGRWVPPPSEPSWSRVLTVAILVTPGNRAAAVVAGLNVIVFSAIAYLAHREKLQKKRNNQLANVSSESVLPADEKNISEVAEVKV